MLNLFILPLVCIFYHCLSLIVPAWAPPSPPKLLCHFSICTRLLLLLGPERDSGDSSPAGAGPAGWRSLSVRGSIFPWDSRDLDIFELIVVIVIGKISLKVSF